MDSGKPKDNLSSLHASTSATLVSEPAESRTSSLNDPELGRYLAIDCEMVGVGDNASRSSLARVSLVDYSGAVILDEYVQQRERVMDYRTRWSGIKPHHLINGMSLVVLDKIDTDTNSFRSETFQRGAENSE